MRVFFDKLRIFREDNACSQKQKQQKEKRRNRKQKTRVALQTLFQVLCPQNILKLIMIEAAVCVCVFRCLLAVERRGRSQHWLIMALHWYESSLALDTVAQCLLLRPNSMTGLGQIYATPTVGQVGRSRQVWTPFNLFCDISLEQSPTKKATPSTSSI